MVTAPLGGLRQMIDSLGDSELNNDGELLARYRTLRDPDAFGSIVRRHAPMVLGVCRRVLQDHHAADDAFQATFLVLVRKADTIQPPDRLGPWLYGVAYRTALKARGRSYRRRQVERTYAQTESRTVDGMSHDEFGDVATLLDEQLNALPEKYRTPLILYAVQGLAKAEVADRLGLPEGTVSSRLARGRELLRDRLARRGVVVPAVALAAILTADTLQAAVPPALTANTAGAAVAGTISTPVLTLSHEVIRTMTLSQLKLLGAIALAVSFAGGLGLVALQADERKPAKHREKPTAEELKPEKPQANPPKPERPDGERPKPERPVSRGGKVAGVDVKENTITIAFKTDSGVVEKFVRLAPAAKVIIDGKEARLADVPKNSTAVFIPDRTREDELPLATELRITGSTIGGVLKKVDSTSITLGGEKADRILTLAPGGTIIVNGRTANLADVRVGSRVRVTLTADDSAALAITAGGRDYGERPAVKPRRFGGKIDSVNTAARTITLAARGEGGKQLVVRVTDNAAITVDGKPAKLTDLKPGAPVTFNLVSARDGQLREVDEVTIAGISFNGSVKRIDERTITIGNEKTDRVFRIKTVGRVMIGEKDGAITDLRVGDRVCVTLTSDESAVVVITAGPKRVRRDKEEPDDR